MNKDKRTKTMDAEVVEMATSVSPVEAEKEAPAEGATAPKDGADVPQKSVDEKPAKGGCFPDWMDLLAAAGVFVFSLIVAAFVASLLMRMWNTDGFTPEISFITYLIQMLPVVAFVMWRRHRAGLDSGIHLGVRRVNLPMVLWGVVLLLASGVVLEPLLELFPSEPYDAVKDAIGLGGWTIMSVVVAAPIIEEALFRGLVFESCRERMGSGGALLISAALFGLIHGIPVQIVNAFVVGLILGYVYLRTRSLLSVIILHAINNALAYVSMSFFGDGASTLSELIQVCWLYWVVYGLSAALFLFAMAKLWRSLHDNAEVE